MSQVEKAPATDEDHADKDLADNSQHEAGVEQIVQEIDEAAEDKSRVSIGDILDAVGHRSFVPVLLLAGLVMLAPGIGDIPGVPVLMGLLVILVAGQLIVHRRHLWVPQWLSKRTVSSSKVKKTLSWLRRPAAWMDRWTKPRLQIFVRHAAVTLIAAVCIVIAAATPLMEVVPMSANLAGAAITAFAVALLRHDGALALLAMLFSLATIGMMIYQLV